MTRKVIFGADMIMVRFGELSTKGKNIRDFIRRLGNNIRESLDDFKNLKYYFEHDHIYILLNGEDFEKVKAVLVKVPGLSSFSLVKAFPRDLEVIKKEALKVAEASGAKTFKVITKRIDKLFPQDSMAINRLLGGYILENLPAIKVDVHNPELEINLTVREECIYLYSDYIPGLGGYPVGIMGKSLHMLSGGIDSPVAAYMMIKRGVKIECIHFAAPPYTSENVIVKLHDILAKLNVYQADIKLYIVPFTDIQKKIYEVAGTSYAITIMRRMMLRIATLVAKAHRDLVISSGESIGQVASQTLPSMVAIEKGSELPIIRPLATFDKVDIIKIAKQIETYDISIRPYEDCCTIFEVKDPTTSPHISKIMEYESAFDFEPMIQEAVKNIKVEHIARQKKEFF